MRQHLFVFFDGDFELKHKQDKGVYSIYFINSDKFYIGSTNCIEGFAGRWRQHIQCLRNNKHSNSIMQHTYNKYGENALRLKIVEICTESQKYILQREQYYIDTLKPTLNINQTAVGCTFPEDWISPQSKPVLQYDLEGNFIKEFNSVSEAQEATVQYVIQALTTYYKEGYTTSAGGYQWRYKIDDSFDIKIPKYKYKQSTEILCYDSNGNFYKEFPSILVASKELNLNCGNISRVVNGSMRSYGKYFFKKKLSEEYPLHIENLLRVHKKQLFVTVEDLETNETFHFNSLRQIPQNIVSRCSLQPYIKKGLKEFIIKRRNTNKLLKIKIQDYNGYSSNETI